MSGLKAAAQAVTRPPSFKRAIILIVGLFFMWGVANNLNDLLIAQFKKAFTLSDFRSGLVQSAFYVGYFLIAIPASMFMRRFGYKPAIVTGLVLYGAGALLFYPAAESLEYGYFLGALFVIAAGLAFLETAANPLMTVLGTPETADRRLNLAQAFNPLGSITGVFFGSRVIFSNTHYTPGQLAALTPAQLHGFRAVEARAVEAPYLLLAAVVLVWAVMTLATRFPNVDKTEGMATEPDGGFAGLLRFPRYWLGVAAQFFYVGAQVGVWSFLIRYAQHNIPGLYEQDAAKYLTASLVLFMLGRFAGTALMGRIPAAILTTLFAAAAVALCLVGTAVGGHTGVLALVGVSIFMSIMFPSIFSLSLRGLGPYKKSGSSFLVMAIIGGAVLTALMGRLSDAYGINAAFLVPAACFAVVLAFAATNGRTPAANETNPA
jgi:FHS family L-fucose permease-like MFS transporter